MTRSIPPSRALAQAAILAFGACLLAPAPASWAFTPSSHARAGGEATPLNLTPTVGGPSHAATSSAGPGIVRTIVGLLVVIAVIWGLNWILRQVKSSRETQRSGDGLASVATLALGAGRTLHLVRAGNDYLLVGSAEHGVAPIHRYTEEQARAAGLLTADEEAPPGTDGFTPIQADAGARNGTWQSRPNPMRSRGADSTQSLVERLRGWTVRR